MKQGWELKDFEECIDRIPRTAKIPKKQFLVEGSYPIISQEDSYINGYWDKPEDLLKVDRLLVIFGDHTKKLKYIDFDFVLGADGVKALLPIKTIDARFFYYQLQSITLSDLGYARHYRLLKQEKIAIPSLEEQKQIVAKLDQAFVVIDKARENASKNLENAKQLFQSKLNEIFSQKGDDWVEKKLGEITTKIGSGATPRGGQSSYKESGIPLIRSLNVYDDGFKEKKTSIYRRCTS
ncbi:Type I restriction-modification system, specificity subunit S [uncultured Candidatus Thioglobus sp.]|nr:Type I restriction-modification system, specificity subunit S [uncultured Candidatus Thioglobus sp.]